MTERLLMRQVREILRLKYEQGLPHRAIARACGVGLGTVSEYCRRVGVGVDHARNREPSAAVVRGSRARDRNPGRDACEAAIADADVDAGDLRSPRSNQSDVSDEQIEWHRRGHRPQERAVIVRRLRRKTSALKR